MGLSCVAAKWLWSLLVYKNLCQTLHNLHNVHSLAVPLHSFNFVSGASAWHQYQSLKIEPVTDVLQDSASHFLSAYQQLET